MTVQGYFDGNAVQTLEPVDLKVNQIVYINIPTERSFIDKEAERKESQKAALRELCGLLTPDEAKDLDESLSHHLKFKTVEL